VAKPAADVTEAELAVLQFLWQANVATMRQVMEALYPAGGASAYATVQKLLERLEGKGLVERTRTDGLLRFHPLVSRDDLIARRLRRVAEQLCDGSLAPLLSHLVRADQLTARERAELRKLLADLTDEDRSPPHRPGAKP
jgi:BlaI family penicillinase repressor